MPDFNRERAFASGADRSSDKGKSHPDRAWSPLVIEEFAKYMLAHNGPQDRREDQWQLGMSFDSFMESGFRHFHAWWSLHKGVPVFDEKGKPVEDIKSVLCAVLFNAQGYLHEILIEEMKMKNPEGYAAMQAFLKKRNGK